MLPRGAAAGQPAAGPAAPPRLTHLLCCECCWRSCASRSKEKAASSASTRTPAGGDAGWGGRDRGSQLRTGRLATRSGRRHDVAVAAVCESPTSSAPVSGTKVPTKLLRVCRPPQGVVPSSWPASCCYLSRGASAPPLAAGGCRWRQEHAAGGRHGAGCCAPWLCADVGAGFARAALQRCAWLTAAVWQVGGEGAQGMASMAPVGERSRTGTGFVVGLLFSAPWESSMQRKKGTVCRQFRSPSRSLHVFISSVLHPAYYLRPPPPIELRCRRLPLDPPGKPSSGGESFQLRVSSISGDGRQRQASERGKERRRLGRLPPVCLARWRCLS